MSDYPVCQWQDCPNKAYIAGLCVRHRRESLGDALKDSCECQCGKTGCASSTDTTRRRAGVTQHGTTGAAKFCSCELCLEAMRAASKVTRKRRSRLRDTADRNGYEWTGAELEQLLRKDLPVKEIATRLGRSYDAVVWKRRQVMTDPKWMQVVGYEPGKELQL